MHSSTAVYAADSRRGLGLRFAQATTLLDATLVEEGLEGVMVATINDRDIQWQCAQCPCSQQSRKPPLRSRELSAGSPSLPHLLPLYSFALRFFPSIASHGIENRGALTSPLHSEVTDRTPGPTSGVLLWRRYLGSKQYTRSVRNPEVMKGLLGGPNPQWAKNPKFVRAA